jgi:hypothetical protein
MSKTYQAVAIRTSTWSYRDGVKVYEDVADCGHHHRTIDAASNCLGKLAAKGSTLWYDAEVRDNHNMPLPNPYR